MEFVSETTSRTYTSSRPLHRSFSHLLLPARNQTALVLMFLVKYGPSQGGSCRSDAIPFSKSENSLRRRPDDLKPRRRKQAAMTAYDKELLFRTTPHASLRRLLGVTSPSHSAKKTCLDSCTVSSPSSTTMFFLSSSSKKRSIGKVKKRSIISFLAKVSLKVKQGKFAQLKPQQQEEVSSGHVTSDDVRGSIDTSGSMSYKCAAESSDSLDEVFLHNSTMDADSDDSMSLEETKLNMDSRLTPLSFDGTQVTNHFKSSSGGEDFSLHKVLSPRVDPSNPRQEAHLLAPSMDLDDLLDAA